MTVSTIISEVYMSSALDDGGPVDSIETTECCYLSLSFWSERAIFACLDELNMSGFIYPSFFMSSSHRLKYYLMSISDLVKILFLNIVFFKKKTWFYPLNFIVVISSFTSWLLWLSSQKAQQCTMSLFEQSNLRKAHLRSSLQNLLRSFTWNIF